jgi:hypothetical protein
VNILEPRHDVGQDRRGEQVLFRTGGPRHRAPNFALRFDYGMPGPRNRTLSRLASLTVLFNPSVERSNAIFLLDA